MNVLQLTWSLGLGGTEKTMQIYSKYLHKNNINVIVVGFMNGGPRKNLIEMEGIKVDVLNGDYMKLKKIIIDNDIDIVHIHRSNDDVLLVIEYIKKNTNVRIVETNVFGKITNKSAENTIDLRIFVSMFCARRFMKRYHLSIDQFWTKNRVLYNPIDYDEIFIFEKNIIDKYRASLGIKHDEFVIGRFARNDQFKFGHICIEMLPYLIKKLPNIKYLMIGIPDKMKEKIRKLKVEKYVVEVDSIIQTKDLSLFICSLDLLVHSSLIGESFGCVYSEAMAHNKAIVTNSTPYFDNAQVELIENGKNGYIANNPQSFAEAIIDLLLNENKRKKFSLNASKKCASEYNVANLTIDLINRYTLLLNKRPSDPMIVSKSRLRKFCFDYKNISKREYNKRLSSLYYISKYKFKKHEYAAKMIFLRVLNRSYFRRQK